MQLFTVHRERSLEDGNTHCILKERDIKLIIDVTSVIKDKVQLWIPIKLHHHSHGKRMVCSPFLPHDIAQGGDITLRMYIHEDIPYIVQKIQEDEENLRYHQVHPGRCFGLEPESSDLELECNGERKIMSTKDLFNQQKTLVSLPITTNTNAKTQIINISVSASSTNQPKTSMAFVVIRTGFSADIHSTLDEMISGSNFDLSNAKGLPSEEFITEEMNTDQYYHFGLALGLSYQTLDSIQFKSRQLEEAGVYTPNRKAAIVMIRFWTCLQHSASLANDHLLEVWKSVSDSGDSAPEEPGSILEMFEPESIPGAMGYWEESLHHKRDNTPSVRSDSTSSLCSLQEEEEGRFPKHFFSDDAHIPGSVRAHKETISTSKHIPDRSQRVPSILNQHDDEEKEQAIFAWMESGEGVEPADFKPPGYTAEPTNDEGQIIESVPNISAPSVLQDESPVQAPESRDDLSEDTDVIRLEKHGIEVRLPANAAYSAKDITVEPILDIPPELVLKETEAIITVGLRMSPSDANFDIPVTITMPHCGIFTKPEAAEIVTYYRKNASENFTAIPSTNGSPRCVVRHHDLDIYMNHFSEIWIVAVFKRTFIGKRVICTPYIPVSTPKNDEHVLFVHVRDENIKTVKVQHGYRAPITGEQFIVKWRSGGLRITCKESTPTEDEVTTLQESQIRNLTEHKVMFTVDTRTTDKNKVILHFILKQSTTKQLLVPMYLEDTTMASPDKAESASARPSASPSAGSPPTDAAAAAADEVSTSKARPTEESRERNFDEILRTIAKGIHKDDEIDNLGGVLGFEPPEIRRYIQTNEKYQTVTYMGTLSMLRDWRNRTTRSEESEKLKKALIAINHRRLADDLLNDDMAN